MAYACIILLHVFDKIEEEILFTSQKNNNLKVIDDSNYQKNNNDYFE